MPTPEEDSGHVKPGHGSHRKLGRVHHSRKGLSVPVALRGVEGVPLDVSEVPAVNFTEGVTSGGRGARGVVGLEDVRAELTIELQHLPRMEKTDAALRVFAVLFTWLPSQDDGFAGSWEEYGRTEIVQHGSSPRFTHAFILNLLEDRKDGDMLLAPPSTRCQIQVYSRVGASLSLADQVLLGDHQFSLSELYHVPGRTEKKKLPNDRGSLTVRMTPIEVEHYSVSVAISGESFRTPEGFNPDKGSLPDVFFMVLRGGKGDVANVEAIYRSETMWQADSPQWKPFEMTLHRLCIGELDHMLVFEVYDWRSSGDHVLLGSHHMTARQLVGRKMVSDEGFPLILPPEGKADTYPQGVLHITGDMRTQLPPDEAKTETGGYTVYYADVGDAAKHEDQRFLAGLMSDPELKRCGLREVVDDGIQAVAERDFYMNAFLSNRQSVQGSHTKSPRHAKQFGGAFDPTSLLSPVKAPKPKASMEELLRGSEASAAAGSAVVDDASLEADADEEVMVAMAARESALRMQYPSAAAETAAAARARSNTPSMLKRQRNPRHAMRHSFGGVSGVNGSMSSMSLLDYSKSMDGFRSSGRIHQGQSTRRMSQKYQRLPKSIRGVPAPTRDTEGKLFGILFPRKRFGEMHDMQDDIRELLQL